MLRRPFGDPPLSAGLVGRIALLRPTDGDRSSIGSLTLADAATPAQRESVIADLDAGPVLQGWKAHASLPYGSNPLPPAPPIVVGASAPCRGREPAPGLSSPAAMGGIL